MGLMTIALALASLAAAAVAPSYKTVSREGYCTFQARADWKLKEDWKKAEPGATLLGPIPRESISVVFYKDADPAYPSLKAYRDHIEHPNKQVEKTVAPDKKTALDGRPALAVHFEMDELVWATMRVGSKQRILQDFVLGEYAGGFYAVSVSAGAAQYKAASAEFQHFLATFKLLVPAAPSAQ